MSGLEDVLAAHTQVTSFDEIGLYFKYACLCSAIGDSDEWHRAHLAAAIREWLLSEAVVERAAGALEAPTHAPMSNHDPRDGSCRSCPWPLHMAATPTEMARAALTAATEDTP